MAIFKSNTYDGRYLQLTITESVDAKTNTSTLTWTLQSVGGSDNYYSTAATIVTINDTVVYSKGATAWNTYAFPAAKGSKSGTIKVTHNSGGKKSITVGFSTSVYYTTAQEYGGTMNLTDIDRTAPTVTLSTSNITATGVTVKATASVTCDRFDYSIDGGSTWTNYSTTSGKTASKAITGLKPNTTYSIKVRARKNSNEVYGPSAASSIKTLGGSVISSINTITADEDNTQITMSVNVYNTSYTHTLVIKNGTYTILTITDLTLANGTNTITLTTMQRVMLLVAMSSIKKFQGTFILTTYSGSTQIGDTSLKTATVQTTPANSAPTFTEFFFEDSNSAAVGVTGNKEILIQNISTLKLTLTAATPKNGAHISSYSVVAGSKTASGTNTEITVGAIPDSGTVPVIVTAIDSRGYTATVTANITVLEYEGINITEYTMRRLNEVEDTTQVIIGGDITPVIIDGVNKNNLRYLYYRYRKTSEDSYGSYTDITSSTEHDESGFNFESDEWINLDSDYSYYVEFLVTDKLTSDTVTITVPQGTPLLAFRRKMVGVNKSEPAAALDVAGSVMMNGFNVLGLVATLDGTEDLNNLTDGGIYTQALNANASTDKHYPKAIAGFLEVMANPSGYIMQRYTAYDNSAVYVRTRYNNTWYAWKSVTLTTV